MLYPILTPSRLLSDLSGVWDFKLDKSLGNGGTGGTVFSSTTSTGAASEAARSFWVAASTEWLEVSLPALFLPGLPPDCRPPEDAETDVAFVAADNEAESRELVVVGVLVYVVDDAEPRFGPKLERWLSELCFFSGFSCEGEPRT